MTTSRVSSRNGTFLSGDANVCQRISPRYIEPETVMGAARPHSSLVVGGSPGTSGFAIRRIGGIA